MKLRSNGMKLRSEGWADVIAMMGVLSSKGNHKDTQKYFGLQSL